jgi:hypothetical protein
MRDIETLRTWIRVVETVAAICTTAVPVIYSFSSWNARALGRLFMLQGVSFAAALDISTIFTWLRPTSVNVIVIALWVDAVILTFIAASTAALAILILKLNYFDRKADHAIHKQGVQRR